MPETTYYVYDANGQRVRKVTERQAASGQTPTRLKERIYLGGFEIYREYGGDGSTITLERETLSMMDDKHRIALIETRTQGSDNSPQQLVRYQFSNHLDTASLELDDRAQIITYEEYYPHGSTSYQATRSQTETPKRYRYTGKERDEENALYYHGARYYACWLGRWTSCDPAGLVDGSNLYGYVANNPLAFHDPDGHQSLMGLWEYGRQLLNRAALGRNIQLDHPIQVALRAAQRTSPGGVAYYSRAVSRAQRELTVIVETGRGLFHTEVGMLQRVIRQQALAGVIRHESDLVAATRAAYVQAAARTGATVNQLALDTAILSNQATIHRTLAETVRELAALPSQAASAVSGAAADLNIEKAFADTFKLGSETAKVEQVAAKATAVLSKAEPAFQAVSKASKVLAPVARVLKPLAPVARVLGKVAGPIAAVLTVAQVATAKTTEEKVDAGISVVSTGLMMSGNPVAMAAGGGMAVGQVIEKTLDVSNYSSAAGVKVYEGLKKMGVGETTSFVAGGVATVVSTPVAIGVAAVDKSYQAGKRLVNWLGSKL
jgi:RHS repeat-associated protein